MLFGNKAQRRANGVKKGKCPYCGKAMNITKGYGASFYHSCRNCGLSFKSEKKYTANFFDESIIKKEYTERIFYSEIKGDWHIMPDDFRQTIKYMDNQIERIQIVQGDPQFSQMIDDGKKLINNCCPICNGTIKKYTKFFKGSSEVTAKIHYDGLNNFTVKKEYTGTNDNTVTVYQCPNEHGNYKLNESFNDIYYSREFTLNSANNLSESQIDRLKKAAAFSNVRSKTKFWPEVEKG